MSIIVEALKKAQKSLKTTQTPPLREKGALPPLAAYAEPDIIKPKIKKHISIWVATPFLFLAIVLFYFLSHKPIKENLPVPPSPADDSVALKEAEKKASYVSQPIEKENPPAPSQPLIFPSPTITLAEVTESIDLNGIMYTPEKPLAVINGSRYEEGEYIGKFKISEIKEDFVKLTAEGQEFIVRLKR